MSASHRPSGPQNGTQGHQQKAKSSAAHETKPSGIVAHSGISWSRRTVSAVGAMMMIVLLAFLAWILFSIRNDGAPGKVTFGQQFWLTFTDKFFGALFTGVFVAGGAGLIVWALQRRAESRRQARELEHEYVRRCSDIAGPMYLETQRYWRCFGNPKLWGEPDKDALTKAYREFSQLAGTLELELTSRYGWDSGPRITWHQIWDLMTVRYYDLCQRPGRAKEGLLSVNAKDYDGEFHSGLTVNELLDPQLLLTTYRSALKHLPRDLAEREPT